MSHPLTLTGIYPQIEHLEPLQNGGGKDNLGMGYTKYDEQFLIKRGGMLGTAEFIGASVSDACGLPICQPNIVTLDRVDGPANVFGSRIESGVFRFDQSSVASWQDVLQHCCNADAFSALLAVDLVLGNDDRHWNNWLVQRVEDCHGAHTGYRLRAMDFSRSWPTRHPAQHPCKHHSRNTWRSTRDWAVLGASFDLTTFNETCATISRLPPSWLHSIVLRPLIGVFLNEDEADSLVTWWKEQLHTQIIEVIDSIEYGVRP